jgi:hypothetical protein
MKNTSSQPNEIKPRQRYRTNKRRLPYSETCENCGSTVEGNQYDKARRHKCPELSLFEMCRHSGTENAAVADGIIESNLEIEDKLEFEESPDYGDFDGSVEENPLEWDTLGLTSQKPYLFQKKLLSSFFDKTIPPVDIYKHKIIPKDVESKLRDYRKQQQSVLLEGCHEVKWSDVMKINAFAVKHNLSNTTLEEMIGMFKDIWIERGQYLMLPTSIHGFRDPVRKSVSLYKVNQHKYELKDFMFGETDDRGRPFNPVQTSSLDIEEQIARACLLVDPKSFAFSPSPNFDGILSGFSSGKIFELQCQQIHKMYGDTDLFPLAIQFSFDGTTINSSKSRQESPLQWCILNDPKRSMEHIGFVPLTLPYSNAVLAKILHDDLSVRTKKDREEIIKNLRQEVVHQYLYDVFSPLLKFQNQRGMLIRFGKGKDAVTRRCIPVISSIITDNKEFASLTGISYSSKLSKCRLCTTLNIGSSVSLPSHHELRNEQETVQVAQNAHIQWLNKLKSNNSKLNITVQDLELSDTLNWLDRAKAKNIKPSGLKTSLLFTFPSTSEVIIGFLAACCPDILHNVQKGAIETLIGSVVSIMDSVSNIDTAFKNNLAELDRNMSLFPRFPLMGIFRHVHLRRGITPYFGRANKKTTVHQLTNFSSGCIEAWKLPNIMLQMLFSLTETMLPKTLHWWKVNVAAKHDKFSATLCGEYTIDLTVKRAIVTVVNFWVVLKKNTFSEEDLMRFSDLVQNVNAHMLVLTKVKQLLSQCAKLANRRVGDREEVMANFTVKMFSGIKFHMITHLPAYIQGFGEHKCIDTEVSEHGNTIFGKETFERTTKRYATVINEMLIRSQMRQFCSDVGVLKTQDVGHNVVEAAFVFHSSFGYTPLKSCLYTGRLMSTGEKRPDYALRKFDLKDDNKPTNILPLFNLEYISVYFCHLQSEQWAAKREEFGASSPSDDDEKLTIGEGSASVLIPEVVRRAIDGDLDWSGKQISVNLLPQLKCTGYQTRRGDHIESFQIYSKSSVKSDAANFSFLEIRDHDHVEFTVVRVCAILEFLARSRSGDNLSYYFLLVTKMEIDQSVTDRWQQRMPFTKLKYAVDKKNRCNTPFQDLIWLGSVADVGEKVIRPAFVIPDLNSCANGFEETNCTRSSSGSRGQDWQGLKYYWIPFEQITRGQSFIAPQQVEYGQAQNNGDLPLLCQDFSQLHDANVQSFDSDEEQDESDEEWSDLMMIS